MVIYKRAKVSEGEATFPGVAATLLGLYEAEGQGGEDFYVA
jgi:hypothetical protein